MGRTVITWAWNSALLQDKTDDNGPAMGDKLLVKIDAYLHIGIAIANGMQLTYSVMFNAGETQGFPDEFSDFQPG